MKKFFIPIVVLAAALIGCGGGGGGDSSTASTGFTASTSSTATTATTGSTSTSSTASTSSTTATTGTTLANRIVFGVPDSSGTTFSVRTVSPSGGSTQTLASGVSTNIILFVRNPATSGQYVFAGDPTGSGLYGIYKGSSLSFSGATEIVGPNYPYVNSLSLTGDGANVVYVAIENSGESTLFVVPTSGGAPSRFGPADSATVSLGDNDTIAFTAPSVENADIDQVYLRSLSAGAGGQVTQETIENGNHILPALSSDGGKLAYWLQTGTDYDLIVKNLANDQAVALPNPSNIYPQAEAFNPDATRLAIAADPSGSGSGQLLVQNADGLTNPTVILSDANLLGNYGIYWTDSSGRSYGANTAFASVSRLKKR